MKRFILKMDLQYFLRKYFMILFLSIQAFFPIVGSAETAKVRVITSEGVEIPILIYTDEKFDVYTDQQSIKDAIAIRNKTENFGGILYFVFKDESNRLATINKIKDHLTEGRNNTFEALKNNILSYTISDKEKQEEINKLEKRYKSYKPSFGNGGNLDDLKYTTMSFGYYADGQLNGIAGYGTLQVNSPILHIYKTIYSASLTHETNPLYIAFPELRKMKEFDIITGEQFPGSSNEAYIGTENSNWNFLVGTLNQEPHYIKINKTDQPLLYEIIQNIIKTINKALDK